MENSNALTSETMKAAYEAHVLKVLNEVEVRGGSCLTEIAVDELVDGFFGLVEEPQEYFIELLKYARPEAGSRFMQFDAQGWMTAGMVEWEKVAAYAVAGDAIARLRDRGIGVQERD